MPLWDAANSTQIIQPASVLNLHEALDCLISPGQEDSFCDISDPSQTGLRTDLLHWKRRTNFDATGSLLPIMLLALWGDTAPMAHRDSLALLTIKILSGARRIRLWIWAAAKSQLCDCGCKGRHTFEAVWQVVSWSMRALLSGCWPRTDHLGRPWPAGSTAARARRAGEPLRFHAAMVAKCGDWMYFKEVLNLRGWHGMAPSTRICYVCRATIGDAYDTLPSAVWRSIEVSMEDLHAGKHGFVSGVWSIPGLVLSCIRPDWMHVVDLGILQSVMDNCFGELFAQLGCIFVAVRRHCRR